MSLWTFWLCFIRTYIAPDVLLVPHTTNMRHKHHPIYLIIQEKWWWFKVTTTLSIFDDCSIILFACLHIRWFWQKRIHITDCTNRKFVLSFFFFFSRYKLHGKYKRSDPCYHWPNMRYYFKITYDLGRTRTYTAHMLAFSFYSLLLMGPTSSSTYGVGPD